MSFTDWIISTVLLCLVVWSYKVGEVQVWSNCDAYQTSQDQQLTAVMLQEYQCKKTQDLSSHTCNIWCKTGEWESRTGRSFCDHPGQNVEAEVSCNVHIGNTALTQLCSQQNLLVAGLVSRSQSGNQTPDIEASASPAYWAVTSHKQWWWLYWWLLFVCGIGNCGSCIVIKTSNNYWFGLFWRCGWIC